MQTISGLLHLPAAVIPVSAIAVGHPAETKEPRNRYRADYVHHDQW